MDKTLKRQVVMVDKDFEKIIYEDDSGNVKGIFETFQFASTGPSAPYNEGYGQNLAVTRETRKEKVPNMGFRSPLKIEQDKESGDAWVKIAFTTPQIRQDQYGMLFAIKFLNNTENALHSFSAITSAGSVDTQQLIKNIGFIYLNGNVYEYYLVRVASDSQNRTTTTVQLNFVAGLLTNGKMVMEIYEGFTFNNFNDNDFFSASITTRTAYPHQEDFDKHKFKDVMSGDVLLAGTDQNDGTVTANPGLRLTTVNLGKDVMSGDIFLAGTKQNNGTVTANDTLRLTSVNLGKDLMSGDIFLAGTKQNDGTVTANDTLRLRDVNLTKDVMSGDVFLAGTKQNDGKVTANDALRLTPQNLQGAIPYHMTVLLPFSGLQTGAWSVISPARSGFPPAIFPCHGTGDITIRLLTHYFDDDSVIPTSNFTLQYRLIAYKESASGLSRDFHLHTNIKYTNEDGVRPAIKRSGHVFYLNRALAYKPPADCIGYGLELKQIKPTTSLGNESLLVCLLNQALT